MKYFSRPYRTASSGAAMLLGAAVALVPFTARGQSSGLLQILEEPSHLLHSSSQGYLGVLVGDVDSDSAAKLKLKDVRGAVITLIDHDAPAAQAGIRVNDVVTQLNGQTVEGAEQFTRMMREVPAGHKITLVVSRDGAPQTLTIELVDHKKMEHDVWNRLDTSNETVTSAPGMAILSGGGADVPSGGFHMPLFGSTLNVGAMVEPLTSQMADYLGVKSGLMIKQIARKSEAETAGLKAFDVILKVGNDPVATSADWDRALRTNLNKPVQVTILRDRRQQTVTLQVDSKRHHSELEMEDMFSNGDCPLVASLDGDAAAAELARQFSFSDSDLQSMRDQAESFRDQFGGLNFNLSPEQAEQWQKQAEQFREQFKSQPFQFNEQQRKEFQDQLQQFQSPEFQKQMRDQLQQQMQEFQKQIEQLDAAGHHHMV